MKKEDRNRRMTTGSFFGTMKHMKSFLRGSVIGIYVCLIVLSGLIGSVAFADTKQDLIKYCTDAGINYEGGCQKYASDMAAAGAVAPPMGNTGGSDLYTPRYLPPIVQGAQGPGDLVFLIYKYLMGLVGIVAVGTIIWGGILRTTSSDMGKIKASDEYIKNAIKGIILLFGAQVLFNTINPNIIDIQRIQKALQPMEKITPKQFTATSIEFASSSEEAQQGGANPYLAVKIQPCNDCVATFAEAKFNIKSGACSGTECRINKNLLNTLNNLQTIATAGDIQWRMTEGYPPTVDHMSSCHFDGTCVDIGLTGNATAASVNAFINAARAAGLNVVNEYPVGANSQSFETTTGGHLHVHL